MTPQRLRAYVLILMRDVLIPAGGLYLALTLEQSELWQLPLIAGMLGVPLVARGPAPEPEPDTRPPPDPSTEPVE